jgi:hypothetical protein
MSSSVHELLTIPTKPMMTGARLCLDLRRLPSKSSSQLHTYPFLLLHIQVLIVIVNHRACLPRFTARIGVNDVPSAHLCSFQHQNQSCSCLMTTTPGPTGKTIRLTVVQRFLSAAITNLSLLSADHCEVRPRAVLLAYKSRYGSLLSPPHRLFVVAPSNHNAHLVHSLCRSHCRLQ